MRASATGLSDQQYYIMLAMFDATRNIGRALAGNRIPQSNPQPRPNQQDGGSNAPRQTQSASSIELSSIDPSDTDVRIKDPARIQSASSIEQSAAPESITEQTEVDVRTEQGQSQAVSGQRAPPQGK